MTTIAYDGKTLAGDSQTTQGDIRLSMHAVKIFTPQPGESWAVNGEKAVSFGVAGCLQGNNALREALNSCMKGYQGLTGSTRFPKGIVISYLVVTEHGNVYAGGQYENDEMPWLTKVAAPIAVGSGAEFAIGAMAAGASAGDAVSIAARFDVNTGGEIREISHEALSRHA
ncbi:peptidase HslV family [Erwinia phage phiEaH2]|uniref:Uncharacterized protein n=1 Tax=Erwinia phage phiEaH2 TaxID=1029988 RepID=J7KKR9_9CAUD|nr:peptidase HslV family [Erwinia phage phiEaH2]AFQ96730.1 hypothetical protein [Erwinia phage phiEaH2]